MFYLTFCLVIPHKTSEMKILNEQLRELKLVLLRIPKGTTLYNRKQDRISAKENFIQHRQSKLDDLKRLLQTTPLDSDDDEPLRVERPPKAARKKDATFSVHINTEVVAYQTALRSVPDDNLCTYLGAIPPSKARVDGLWKELYARAAMIIPPNFTNFTNDQLEGVFRIIDEVYFVGRLQTIMDSKGSPLTFDTLRSINTAGYCKTSFCSLTKKMLRSIISMSKKVFTDIPIGETRFSNGIPCYTRLECLLNVFLHETIHLLGFASCNHLKMHHGPLFQKIVLNLFGQTDFRHELKRSQDVADRVSRADLKIGDRVKFTDRKGNIHRGTISKLNPRMAKVVTKQFNFPTGTYSVPYSMLSRD